MESSSNKIIFSQNNVQLRRFYTKSILLKDLLFFVNEDQVIRFYISSSLEGSLIIEVILKDTETTDQSLRNFREGIKSKFNS